MAENKNWLMGLWKFSDHIPREELISVAERWAAEDKNYVQLYFRKTSKDQYGIGFALQIPENQDREEFYERYFNQASDQLKRSFGNGLVGWDIADGVTIIKQQSASRAKGGGTTRPAR